MRVKILPTYMSPISKKALNVLDSYFGPFAKILHI